MTSRLEESFADAIHTAERLARRNPGGFALVNARTGLRAIVVRRFPFRLLHAVEDGIAMVVAIAPTARAPEEFRDRA